MKIKLVAFDLDGTLLNSQRELIDEDAEILKRAADAGIKIVPATGRFLGAIPKVIRDMSFVRYYVTMNGAQVFDMQQNFSISRAELPLEQTLSIIKLLDELPVIYECVMEDSGW
ncbi:MAG: HAD family phosphatase, partial [Synergistaceae bacterium]|nr:HAD family phosphatase [Synergistaceae bacterium]